MTKLPIFKMFMKNFILTILFMVLPMTLFAKESKEQNFWKWFVKNENAIFDFEKDQEKVFDLISSKLAALEDNITFEISYVKEGKREFIISAGGISETFPYVESLVNSAPELKLFSVIAFRPRIEGYEGFKLLYADRKFDVSNIWVYSSVKNGFFDLVIYHPDFNKEESNIFIAGSYLLLDMALGEYDVVKHIRYIDHKKLPNNPAELGLKPFAELRNIFDDYKKANNLINQN